MLFFIFFFCFIWIVSLIFVLFVTFFLPWILWYLMLIHSMHWTIERVNFDFLKCFPPKMFVIAKCQHWTIIWGNTISALDFNKLLSLHFNCISIADFDYKQHHSLSSDRCADFFSLDFCFLFFVVSLFLCV